MKTEIRKSLGTEIGKLMLLPISPQILYVIKLP